MHSACVTRFTHFIYACIDVCHQKSIPDPHFWLRCSGLMRKLHLDKSEAALWQINIWSANWSANIINLTSWASTWAICMVKPYVRKRGCEFIVELVKCNWKWIYITSTNCRSLPVEVSKSFFTVSLFRSWHSSTEILFFIFCRSSCVNNRVVKFNSKMYYFLYIKMAWIQKWSNINLQFKREMCHWTTALSVQCFTYILA